jgi:hypothetical protein
MSGLTLFGQVIDSSNVDRSVEIGGTIYTIADQDVQANQVASGLPALGSVVIQTSSPTGIVLVPEPLIPLARSAVR